MVLAFEHGKAGTPTDSQQPWLPAQDQASLKIQHGVEEIPEAPPLPEDGSRWLLRKGG